MDPNAGLLTIGQLARRTGVSARTLRFWSNEEALVPVARSASGYRLYDADCVARVELVRSLRELGLGLDEVRRVLRGRATVAEIAEAHVAALEAQIRTLKVSRAVWSTVSKRQSTAEEATLMNRLARLSVTERMQIIDDFKREVYGGLELEPGLHDRIRDMRIDLPDDPTPEQVDAWIELAGLLQDPEFRARMRAFLELNMPTPGQSVPPGARIWWARQVVESVARVRAAGVGPEEPAAAELVTTLFGEADLGTVSDSLEAGLEAGAERYRGLVSRVRGGPSAPDATADLRWLATALRHAAG
ncbi:MerR family transcriptional regulator [Actinoplanes couchii]|uniref:MerR family transcriptional regulator n=1 Tax=Actinoplanes couchii TaxID=403638 RepID=A0ABQ3XI09_9ACTN|nr:MerR family transcriptional regulator [Actinoplanes couchii]MDR6324587.1 DNA-binding transcriptional MerR regulator [Actinoplanes couchii]GID58139.1 MerR family transcriptional regulator [Actinoplanes couchii]